MDDTLNGGKVNTCALEFRIVMRTPKLVMMVFIFIFIFLIFTNAHCIICKKALLGGVTHTDIHYKGAIVRIKRNDNTGTTQHVHDCVVFAGNDSRNGG